MDGPSEPRDAPTLDTYQALVSAFTEFLTVAVHTILYERDIYPRESFINARKYNCPVRQNRHPKVCAWIQDAVAAVEGEMLKCTVAQTSVIIYSAATTVPLERYVFSTASFPIVPSSDVLTAFEEPLDHHDPELSSSSSAPSSRSPSPTPKKGSATVPITSESTPLTPTIDLTAQFPAVIQRLSTLGGKIRPLPPGCSFTLAVELRDRPHGKAPIGWPMPWVPSEPGWQDPGPGTSTKEGQSGGGGSGEGGKAKDKREDGSDAAGAKGRVAKGEYRGGVRTTPIRAVEAGPFVMEVWVEEGKEKMALPEPAKRPSGETSQASVYCG